MKLRSGWSLIELMLVIAIIAILTCVSIPVYSSFLQKSYRQQAKINLLQRSHSLERIAIISGSYPTQRPDLPSTILQLPYQFIYTPKDNTFDIQAQPIGAQITDECGTLTLSSKGRHGFLSAQWPMSLCW
ncbi:MAG: prepilin-type N-terminal cleavage/methylation domain-containing protein [Limnohabitans sp.]|nr:prepilin-type N-terminal cleavage/methylation domain-containing protein [Limnohabitans sp.]